jgi:hypothetical protein
MFQRETSNDNRSQRARFALLALLAIAVIGLTWLAGGFDEAAVLMWGGVVVSLAGAIR